MASDPSRKVSLADVAREAGVSRSAVSYALRNVTGVSPETRKRILSISQKLGYVPDAKVDSQMRKVRAAKDKKPASKKTPQTKTKKRSDSEPKASLADIAREAGVSRSAVSYCPS